jgi:RNA polymerase sigma-70 factor (ECF subfamily)
LYLTDQEIIARIKSGDESAFRELIRRYESRIAATVIGILGQCPEAEDVGQETFIRFYKKLTQFRMEASVGTYLTRIAMNLSFNELKRRKRKNNMFTEFTPAVERASLNLGGEPEPDYQEINNAVKQLPQKLQSVLVLRLKAGYSTAETSQILNIPEGTVLSRLSRAIQKLKSILTPIMGEII